MEKPDDSGAAGAGDDSAGAATAEAIADQVSLEQMPDIFR